jgi:chemotaxis protein methyltransferase CheR
VDLPLPLFDELRRLIHRLCGLVIGDEKAYLIRHRLEPVVRASGCSGFAEFVQTLRGPHGPALHDAIIEAITTSETSFFRDGHPFEAFRRHVLPALAEAARARTGMPPRVRLWSVAASTGQEPYSLAMLVLEYLAANPTPRLRESDFAILATDVSAKVLADAAAGRYTERELARGLTPEQVARYFTRQGETWVVGAAVRRLVEFRRLNLVQSLTGLGPFDAVFCRNVLIYFDDVARRRLCEQFHALLSPGGFLVLGAAESLYGVCDCFESVRLGDTLLYRKPDVLSSGVASAPRV